MQKNKTKLSVVTLMITAIVCFIVAILGMGMTKNSVPTMADSSSVQAWTATLNGVDSTNKSFEVRNRLPISEDATKVYIEYVLGNDDGAGHSFLFGLATGTMVAAYTQDNLWNGSETFSQANSHIASANNAGLYTASYKVTFDLETNQMTWYRGTTLILEKTGTAFANATSFGFFTYTTAVSGSMEVKIYDDTGKDLGIRSIAMAKMTIEFPKVTFEANNGDDATVVEVTGTTVAAPTAPTKEGYIFNGWYVDEELTTAYDFSKEVSKDMTLYAKWVAEPNTYYMISDSTQSDPWKWSTVEAPAENATKVTITFKVISRTGTGRHFQMLAIDGTTEKTSLLHGALKFSDEWFANGVTTTFVADLTAKTYSLYNANGVKWDSTSLTFESANKFGAVIYKQYPAAVIGLYEITAVDDTGKDLGITSSSKGVTITTDKVYTVNMNANNGEAVSKSFVTAGSTLAKTTPLYAGHLFKGWFTDAELTTAYDFTQEVASDLNLYAKWVSIENVTAKTVSHSGTEGTNTELHLVSRLPHSEDATKVYIEYTLGNDDAAGHSFLFGKSVGTFAGAFSKENVWQSIRWTQANSHIAVANNAALYTASYTIVFDFATNSMLWYRGSDVILTGTSANLQGNDMNFADAIAFGMHTYTTAAGGNLSIKIYDDMGKDLGITTWIAKSTKVTYPKATFDLNYEGGEDKVVDVTRATITAPTGIAREGYNFIGWYTDAECTTAYDFTKEVVGDITVYAKWEEIPQVVVTFNANGGADVAPQTIYVDTKATAPTSTKTGYDFEGWYLDAELTQKFDFNTVVTEDITLYANWTIQVYEVVFNTNGGNTIDNATVEYNQTLTLPTAPTKVGYNFVGWFVDEALETAYDVDSVATEGFTLYAKWTIQVYEVVFNTNGGNTIDNATVEYNQTLTLPTAPTKVGYTFVGWFVDETLETAYDVDSVATEGFTLYAKWEIIVFTVSFNTNGGTAIEAQQVNFGGVITQPTAPEKEGFTFDGWYVDAEATEAFDFTTIVDEDITLYAKWTAIPVVDDGDSTDEPTDEPTDKPADTKEPNIIDKLVSKVTNKLGCAGSLAQDSFMIIGTMLTVAGVIVIKALKKKED